MRKQRGFQLWFCTFAVILLAIVGCWQLQKFVLVQKGLKALRESAPSEKFEYIHKFYYHVNKKFEKGMSKEAVRAIIGSPQNTDSTYIWIWCAKTEASASHSNWFDMPFAGAGYYLIFYEDKLLTDGLRKAAEGWDWDVLANELGIGVKEARKILMEEQALPQVKQRNEMKNRFLRLFSWAGILMSLPCQTTRTSWREPLPFFAFPVDSSGWRP